MSDVTVRDQKSENLLDEGDHERFAHYVNKTDMTKSAVTGTPVRALFVKKGVPSRNPERFPVCPDCKKIYETLKATGR